jgi:hypothetical protein
MLAGFAAHNTRVKGLVELLELLEKALHSGASQVKVGLNIWVLLGATSG